MKYPWKIKKEQVLCLLAGVILCALSFLTGKGSVIKEAEGGESTIERPGYGEEAADYKIEAYIEGEEKEITVHVSGREYTEDEAGAQFEKLMDLLIENMAGENKSLTEARKDLLFLSSVNGFPGINISYSPSDRSLIASDGRVLNEELSEPAELTVEMTLRAGKEKESFCVPVTVYPREITEESIWEAAERLISEADESSINGAHIFLPESINGKKVTYKEKTDLSPLLILLLSVVSCVLLTVKPKEDELKKKKQRETELLMDYSEIVSGLSVYIGAGLTIRNAWKELSKAAENDEREVYREVLRTERELSNGVSESEAYMGFGKRCGLKCYIRLASLLDRQRVNGDGSLLSALTLEMEEAFEQRKNTARRLGEEAGTRLLLPLMMSLITVMIIILAPAVMKML